MRGIIIAILVILSIGVSLAEVMQTYYKIYLQPSYVESVSKNRNYYFNLEIKQKGDIDTAFITFKTYVKKDLVATLNVNGINCINRYYIDKNLMSEGYTDLFFDCSNAIKKEGNYTLTLNVNNDIGSIFGYAEITYRYGKDELKVFGTEYTDLDTDAKIWVQLLDKDGKPIDNAVCFVNVYKPNNTVLFNNVVMNYLDDGIYYYDFPTPDDYGVYPVVVYCSYYYVYSNKYPSSFYTPNQYTGVLSDFFEVDGNITSITENRTLEGYLTFNNLLGLNTTNLILDAVIRWSKVRGDPNNDYINFYYWNGSTYVKLPNSANYFDGWQEITNNIPMLNNTIIIKFNDTLSDNSVTTLSIDKIIIKDYSLLWSFNEVKGGGEIHKQKFVGTKVDNIVDLLLANKDILKENFVSNHNICIDNKTLAHNITYNYCIGNECKDYSYLRLEECKYGCSDDRCNPSPLFRTIIFIVVVIIIPIILIKFILKM
jgi:hypothetical protein